MLNMGKDEEGAVSDHGEGRGGRGCGWSWRR